MRHAHARLAPFEARRRLGPHAGTLALASLCVGFTPAAAAESPAVESIALSPRVVFVAEGAHCAAPTPRLDGGAVALVVDDRARARRTLHRVEHGAEGLAGPPESPGPGNRLRPTEAPVAGTARDRASDLAALQMLAGLEGGSDQPGRETHAICHEFAWTPGGGFVASCVERDGQYDLFAARPGGPMTPFVSHPAHDGLPAVDGTGRVVFSSGRTGDGDLYLVGPHGADPRPLVRTEGTAEMHARWSPDGTRVLYLAQRSGKGDGDLFVLSTAGPESSPRRLTRGGGAEIAATWSPDGRWIAWYRARPDATGHTLFVVSAAGGTPRPLVDGVVAPDRVSVAWTPDSRGIVYARDADPTDPLEVVSLGDGAIRRLKTDTLLNHSPAVVALPGGRWRLYWVAQASTGDAERRWDRIYGAELEPPWMGGAP